MLQYMLDTLVYILFKKLLTTGCDQGCHELLETCAMEIKRNETVWGGERLDEMKNSGMSETMRSLTRKSVCALLSLLLLLSAVLPVKAVAETAPIKIIRVGSFEDTFKGSFARTFVRAKAPFLCAFCKKAHPLPQRNRTRVIFVNKYVKID